MTTSFSVDETRSVPPRATTVAGRHAADVRRHRELLQQAQDELVQELARERLARALAGRGLATQAHLHPALGDERAIWIDCRLEQRITDHELAYAIFDELGWERDRARLSRINARYDVLRLRHPSTGAAVAMIIKIPCGALFQWEVA